MTRMTRSTLNNFVTYKQQLDARIYKENIVSVDEFLSNPYYLGDSFSCGKTLYPCWKKTLVDLFDSDTKYIAVFTGATSTGKTTGAYAGLAYLIYKHLLLKDIWKFYQMSDGGKVGIAFFNLTKTLSASKGFDTLQNFLVKSEWFRRQGTLKGGGSYIEFPQIEWVLASPNSAGFSTVGHHIIGAVMDEVDSPNATVSSQKKIIDAFNSTILRLEGRFLKDQKTLGRFFLVSSKQETMSFLNTYVESIQKAKDSTTRDKLYLADFSRWDALPASEFSGKKFRVSIGDMFNLPRLIRDPNDEKLVLEKGFKVIEVPEEYYGAFDMDVIKALRDIAGVSAESMSKGRLFTNSTVIDNCWDSKRENPVTVPTIETGLDDHTNWLNYIDFSKFTVSPTIPRYIHGDIAFTEDAFGLAMSCISGHVEVKRQMEDGTFGIAKVPIAHVDFIFRIKARDGDRIPLHKIRRFILDLKDRGFNIAKYTSDLRLASEDTFQILNNAGIEASYFSMDQPITNYIEFRDLVIEHRVNCYKHNYLKLELTYLEHDRTGKGKIDHPTLIKDIQYMEDGSVRDLFLEGSKDIADSVAASCLNALHDGAVPIDMELMNSLMTVNKQETSKVDEILNPLLPSVDGQKVIGTMEAGNLKQFNELFENLF